MSKVLVIGGGAAGMMAAIWAARNDNNVILIEQNEKLGKKLFITGKGRCNLTNDCDRDTLLIFVKPDGPACHLGNYSCFVDEVMPDENEHEKFTLCGLMELIKGRKTEKVEGSYTSYLFEKGLDKILKKIGEESSEVIIAAKNDRKETIYEISDLIYHMLVLMAEMNIEIKDVIKELASRHVIDKKVKQEKMTS